MPGIAGIIGPAARNDGQKAVSDMVKAMMHERFYKSATCVNDGLEAVVGWVNIKGSFSDCMPVWNETRDVCLIFSGEHHADPVERERLKAGGHKFANGNASYLVHLYEEQGPRFFESLNGLFSGVVLDLREKKAVLFNDRYGLARIYYHEDAEGIYFASEAKAILKIRPALRQLDTRSLAELLNTAAVMQNRSLFPGISVLPAGSAWTFQPQAGTKKDTYFNRADWENQGILPAGEYYKQIRDTFARVLPRYGLGGEEVALSITGGLDTRMIAAWTPALPYRVQTYTFGGMLRECEDVIIGRNVAKTWQQYHEVIVLSPKFFAEFPSLASRTVYVTDGAMDVSGAPGLFLNRKARDLAPVRLTGNFGDEILRGNVTLKCQPVSESLFNPGFVADLRRVSETYDEERYALTRQSFITFRQMPWFAHGRMASEQGQLTIRNPFLDNEFVKAAYRVPPELAESLEMALRIIADGNEMLSKFPIDRGYMLGGNPVAARIREKFQRFTFRAEYAYDYGMPPWLLKMDNALARLRLSRQFLGRHKFYHFRTWYRNELSQYVKDVLLDPRTLARPYLNGPRVEQIVKAHTTGAGNHTVEIHKLLTAELIQRQLIEQN